MLSELAPFTQSDSQPGCPGRSANENLTVTVTAASPAVPGAVPHSKDNRDLRGSWRVREKEAELTCTVINYANEKDRCAGGHKQGDAI